jgi:hypothetical protein
MRRGLLRGLPPDQPDLVLGRLVPTTNHGINLAVPPVAPVGQHLQRVHQDPTAQQDGRCVHEGPRSPTTRRTAWWGSPTPDATPDVRTYTYDGWGRLTAAVAGGTSVSYVLDALDRTVRRTKGPR